MNIYRGTIFIFFAAFLILSNVAEAQLINYERRNRTSNSYTIQTPQTTTAAAQATQHSRATTQKAIQKFSEPSVTNRFEQAYDANEDGFLQKDEIQSLYKYVLSAIERRGRARISSNLLDPFDVDQDGVLSRSEVVLIKEAIR